MRISRYIKFPLIFGILMAVSQVLIGTSVSLNSFLGWFVYGAVFGIGMQLYSDYRTRKVKPDAQDGDFAPTQKTSTFLLYDFDTAFDVCLDSIGVLNKGKLKFEDKSNGVIKAKTGVSWNSWGNMIEYKLHKLTESSAELEISITPILRTVLVDNGEALRAIETLNNFFAEKNESINRQLVEAKYNVETDFYINRTESDKVNTE